MIYTVTFNPAVDYVMHPLTLDMGFTNRSSSEEVRCGGNGINVSSILNELNVDTICLGIIAGFTGDYILDTLQSAGVTCNFVRLDKGFTRINVKLNGIVMTIINGMGLMPSAGYGVAQKLTSFIMLIPSSVMQSVSAFVAQNTGAGKKDRAWKGFLTAIATGCSLGVVIFCIGFFGGSVISRIFTSDPAVIEQSAAYLRGFAPECILTCVLFSSIGYFNGRGISIPVMIQGITSACLIRIPLALFFSHLPNTNLTFVGMSTPITTVYGICFFMICFARLKKKGQM